MDNLNLTDNEIKEKIKQWNKCKTINPFTKRNIKINGPTYKKLDMIYIRLFDVFYKKKEKTKIEYIIYNIFFNNNFNKSYDLELKKYLYVLVYLEFRTRELYLQYFNIPNINYENKIIKKGQPFKNIRLIFYNMIKLNKIPNYTEYLINNKISNNYIEELKILYKSYYELLSEHTFENKYIVTNKDINFEKKYIIEEFKDTKEYFYKIDKLFENNPKYNNIKVINNTLEINFNNLSCDNCGKKGPKLKCSCGVNVYCNESCEKKDFKLHYENCKYI